MSIEVHVRVRPGVTNPVWASAETVLYSTADPDARYVYNKVHPDNSANKTIFQGVEALVHAAFDGKNVTVMAYGQTGSGKTYSMIGTEADPGLTPRTARLLLELQRTHPGTTVHAYYTEIYNESVKDLLDPQRGELALHDAPDGGVTYDKRMVRVESYEDFLRLQAAAERNRKYAATSLNDHSSRSHIILTFEIVRAHRSQRSVINLVDLAGSESAARANTAGMSLREGGFINKSLLTLGNVVDAIVDKRSYVPYRDTKLTRILRTCLGGTGITLILCCISPSRENYEQTTTALRFTQRAMRIKNDPVVVLHMPPLFAHQLASGASQLMASVGVDAAAAEYQRGLRDAYLYCNNNVASSVVDSFQARVADSMHAMANAQRLLIAHDHAMSMDRVGRLHNQLGELDRQRGRDEEVVRSERKRLRDGVEEVEARREKVERLAAALAEQEAAADTTLAGWEYQLHEARAKQVRPLALLAKEEEAQRVRIGYEWSVCVERITSLHAPALNNLMTAAAAAAASNNSSSSGINIDDEDGGGGGEMGIGSPRGATVGNGGSSSRAAVMAALRERLARARAELADLELAHEMVREDVELARRTAASKSNNHSNITNSDQGKPKSRAQLAVEQQVADEEARALARNRDVTDAELAGEIAELEREERLLHAQAKREVRRESFRQVRESLRRPSRSPQTAATGGGGLNIGFDNTNSNSCRGASGTPPPRKKRIGGGGNNSNHDDTLVFDEFDGSSNAVRGRRGPAPGSSSGNARTVSASLSAPTASALARNSRSRSRSSSSAAAAAARDNYDDNIRNALSVLDGLKTRLLPHRGGGGGGGAISGRSISQQQQQQYRDPANSSSSSKYRSSSIAISVSPAHRTGGGNNRHRRQQRNGRDGDDDEEGQAEGELTFLEMYGSGNSGPSGQSPSSTTAAPPGGGGRRNTTATTTTTAANGDEKENYFGYQSRPGQSKAFKTRGGGGGRNNTNNMYEIVAEDDEAFSSGSNTTATTAKTTTTMTTSPPPQIVGIAARRKWAASNSHSQSPRPEVERALYPLHSNSHSMERRSNSRRGY